MDRKRKPKVGSTFERLEMAIQRIKEWNRKVEIAHQKFLDEWLWTFKYDAFGDMSIQEFNHFKYILEKYDI